MKHSVNVFFAKHGLESCWRLGVTVVEPDQSIVFYGLESCWRSGVVEPDQSIVFYGFQKSPAWGILSACFLLGMGSTHAGVRLFRNRSFVFYGFQRWREAFCLRVFCLAWARILLVFRSFRIWRWRDFEQPSFGSTFHTVFCLAEARLLLAFGCFGTEALFFMGSKGDVKHSVCMFFACGMGSNLAGVSVFSNLTLTKIWVAMVRNPRSCLWLYMCVSNVLVRHPFWCTNRVLRALILLVFRSFRIYSWQKFDSHRQESTLVFICIYLYREFGPPLLTTHASACRSAALLVQKSRLRALILLLFRSFRIWSWRQFDQPSSAIHACVRFWLVWARVELVFGCLFGSEADEDSSIHFSGWLIWGLLVAVFGRITSRSSALRDMFSHWVAGATIGASRGQWSKTPPCHISGMRAWTHVSPGRLSLETACHSARTRAPLRFLSSYGLSRGKTGIHMHAGLPCFSSVFLCFVHPAELRLGSTWGHCLFELVSDAVPHSQAFHLASGGYALVLQSHIGLHCCVFRAYLFEVFCSCL